MKIIKRLLKTARNKRKKHNEIVMIAKSKINSIETLISQAVIDSEISHKEFKTFINEKEKYEKMKKKIKWKFKKLMLKKDELNEEEGEKIKTNKNTGENNENA